MKLLKGFLVGGFLGIALILFMFSCEKKEDINGKFEGAWECHHEDADLKGDIEITITEDIIFSGEDRNGTSGDFWQGFFGIASTDSNQTIPYTVTVTGVWDVEDINNITLNYDMSSMNVTVGNKEVLTPNQKVIDYINNGDWSSFISAASELKSNETPTEGINAVIQKNINSYFKGLFHDVKKTKKGLVDVVIDNSMLTAKVIEDDAEELVEVTYDKIKKNTVAALFKYQVPVTVAPVKKRESAVAPAGGSAYMPNYDWLSYSEATPSDLSGKSKGELRIMRNYIYARHGYKFKSTDLQQYFSQYGWYTPLYSDVSSQLNKIEKYNVALIQRYE